MTNNTIRRILRVVLTSLVWVPVMILAEICYLVRLQRVSDHLSNWAIAISGLPPMGE